MGAMRMFISVLLSFSLVMHSSFTGSEGFTVLPRSSISEMKRMQKEFGSLLGVVVPNAFEMNPLLQSSSFQSYNKLPYLDIAGKRFRLGRIGKKGIVMVMTGLGMLNAGVTTQLLLTLFKVEGIVHFGIAGNANSNLQIGDVTIPRYWSHAGLWYWQRYGDGVKDELSLESAGDYTRTIGYLNISDYSVSTRNGSSGNFLNSLWYQPEEIFPVNGVPEVRQHAFWVSVDSNYYQLSRQLEGLKLQRCVNATTCLPRSPKVVRVERGCSADVFVDNAAYRSFLNSEFNITPIDMETAAVALVSLQQRVRFIAIRSLSDLAGGGSSLSNEAALFASLAAQNAVDAVVKFISFLN